MPVHRLPVQPPAPAPPVPVRRRPVRPPAPVPVHRPSMCPVRRYALPGAPVHPESGPARSLPPDAITGLSGRALTMGRMTASPGRRVLLAAPRGYCAGVDRAVIAVEKALEQYGAPVYVRHEIVHNKYVVQTLEKKGAVFVERTEEVPPGNIVMFSAHGVAPVVHEEAARGRLATIDATCPLVTKVHKEAVRFASEDYDILLIGHEGHEEVIGTSGEAPDHIQLVDGPEDVAKVEVRDPSKVVWLSQTTLSVDETMETVDALKGKFPQLISPPSDDICYATQNRQLGGQADGRRGGPGDRGRLAELLQLRAARRGRQDRGRP
ncbi:4-hydroxy-3-methylbut-2-enyl diphosphate reductase [Streptomyces hirsutus]